MTLFTLAHAAHYISINTAFFEHKLLQPENKLSVSAPGSDNENKSLRIAKATSLLHRNLQ